MHRNGEVLNFSLLLLLRKQVRGNEELWAFQGTEYGGDAEKQGSKAAHSCKIVQNAELMLD